MFGREEESVFFTFVQLYDGTELQGWFLFYTGSPVVQIKDSIDNKLSEQK